MTREIQGRIPPHSEEAEEQVLGAILTEGAAALLKVVADLDAGDFYRESRAQIYRACRKVFDEGEPVDILTVAAELEKRGALEAVGGRAYIAKLTVELLSGANIRAHAKIVRDRALKRTQIAAGSTVVDQGYDESTEPLDSVADSIKELTDAMTRGRGQRAVWVGDSLPELWKQIEARKEGALPGLHTGFPDIDRISGGLRPGEVTVLGGRPSMGKTSLAMQIGLNVCAEGKRVIVFSLEMTRMQLEERALGTLAHVDSQRISKALFGQEEKGRLYAAMLEMSAYELFIDEGTVVRSADMAAQMRAQQAAAPVDLMIVDYLQLMKGTHNRDNIVLEVAEITRDLKLLAKDLNIPVFLLSQLSRGCESRPDKRPMLSDLRDSGAIEQDADQVWFAYRDEYYYKERSEKPGIAEIIVSKNRNGPTGTVELLFQKEITKFESLERRHHMGGGPEY